MHIDLNADESPEDVVLPVETRVKNGMLLLDEKMPGWERRINVATLRIDSSCSCVLGQLSGTNDYAAGADLLFGTRGLWADQTVEGGFFPTYGEMEWDDLTQAWKHAILARRLEAQ
jgi:hypothetical protein